MDEERDAYFDSIGIPFSVFQALAGKGIGGFSTWVGKRTRSLESLKSDLLKIMENLKSLQRVPEDKYPQLAYSTMHEELGVVVGSGITTATAMIEKAIVGIVVEIDMYKTINDNKSLDQPNFQNAAFRIGQLLEANCIKSRDFEGAKIMYYLYDLGPDYWPEENVSKDVDKAKKRFNDNYNAGKKAALSKKDG
jgi:hypothetical protein